MEIRLEDAKNASSTCAVDGRFLHSTYNPENEAKNFVNSIVCDYTPSCIIVTSPGLGYCLEYIHLRFSDVPVYVIQYNTFFLEYNTQKKVYVNEFCKKTFLCTSKTRTEDLSESLFSCIGELELASSLCVSWTPSRDIFPVEDEIAWKAIKLTLAKTRDVIATRSYFSLRWLKNTLKYCVNIQSVSLIKTVSKPIAIIASGPTLKYNIDFLQKNKGCFFIICLSSALEALLSNDIVPDLCMSTDGGYYAQKHLHILYEYYKKGIHIPLAISSESNIPSNVLEHCTILPLRYDDSLDEAFFSQCAIPSMVAYRNGSVSGTAADFALSLTEKEVYAFGLDLEETFSYSHIQPNAHEKIHMQFDCKLKPLEGRTVGNVLKNTNGLTSLDIYRLWFETRGEEYKHRFFRVKADGVEYKSNLGSIKDISSSSIPLSNDKETTWVCKSLKSKKERMNIVLKNIKKLSDTKSDILLEHLALAEYIVAKKYPQSSECEKNLFNKIESTIKILQGICT